MDLLQINRLFGKLLPQGLGFTTSIAWHIGRFLGIWQRDQLHARVGLEDRPEALECCVDGAAERRRGDQVDLGVSGKGFAQFCALLVAEICEEGVADNMVGCAEIVDALEDTIMRLYSRKPNHVNIGGYPSSLLSNGVFGRLRVTMRRPSSDGCVQVGRSLGSKVSTYLSMTDSMDNRRHCGLGS